MSPRILEGRPLAVSPSPPPSLAVGSPGWHALTRTPCILLVDDNPDDRALAIRALRQDEPALRVAEITSSEAFEQALTAGDFDVVVTDYLLRWSDGLTVLRRVKERKADCPVILFTDSGSEEVAVEAMKAGADDYVIKVPQRAQRLATAIRLALERAELRARERAARAEAERQQAEAIRLAATLHTSAALAEALTPSQVADVAIEQG